MSAMDGGNGAPDSNGGIHDHWLISFLINVAGYCVIIIPAALLVKWVKHSPNLSTENSPLHSIFKYCVLGRTPSITPDIETGRVQLPVVRSVSPNPHDCSTHLLKLLFYIVSLQLVYVSWGVLQECVMTQEYSGERFTNSQFLVFSNRILALCVSGVYLAVTSQPTHTVPFYKYSYSSLSNILSSWCQYEALKFVSFPTQVLAKSCKVIAVMLMSKVVSNKSYSWQDYLMVGLISSGLCIFLLSANTTGHRYSTETTLAGVAILCGYLGFDSFTSNWQSELFKYKMSPVQMMFGVNVFSSVLTLWSLLMQGAFFTSLFFLYDHWKFMVHAMTLSLCSAIGQIFIFHTIKEFGPIVFSVIMTSRQAISIIISCVVYDHTLSPQAMVGMIIVFAALFIKAYLRYRTKTVH